MTLQQCSRNGRKHFKKKPKALAFAGAPHRRGIIERIMIFTPRKPNSAQRTVAKVILKHNKKMVFAKIPGIGKHGLQKHSQIFVRGHGPKDTPGVNYHLVRGKDDFIAKETHIDPRINRRSKFGLKKKDIVKKIKNEKI
jgi:small subunit ribosomal protein S12